MSAVCQRTECQRTECAHRALDRSAVMVVVDLEAVRVERLAEEIADSISATGSVRVAVVDVEDVGRWRRAARRAGRLLGWHIRTGESSDWVWATSEDWLPGPGADWRAARTFAALIAPLDRREREES